MVEKKKPESKSIVGRVLDEQHKNHTQLLFRAGILVCIDSVVSRFRIHVAHTII